MAGAIGTAFIEIRINDAAVRRGIRQIVDELKDVDKQSDKTSKGLSDSFDESARKSNKSVNGIGDNIARSLVPSISGIGKKIVGTFTGMFTLSAKTAATAFSAQFIGSVLAGLASGAAKLAQGLGALVALLPAAALTGVVAFGTLKLAVLGVGDALSAGLAGDTEKFNKALEKLAPAAQQFAREVIGMRSALDAVKIRVQQGFFTQFAGDTSKLGATFLPMIRDELGKVGASFGLAIHQAAGFLRLPSTVFAIRGSLVNVRAALANLTRAVVTVVKAFIPLTAVGTTFLPRLTAGISHATARFADLVAEAAKTGALADFIQRGLSALESLFDTATQVWRILKNLVAIFSQFSGLDGIFAGLGIQTGGLLDSFEELTRRARDFFETSQGGQAIAVVFQTIRSILGATLGTLSHVVVVLGGALGPILPQLAAFAEAIARLQIALVDALAPALGLVATAIGVLLPVITTLLNFLANNQPVIQAIAIAIGVLLVPAFVAWAVAAGTAAIATIAATGPLLLLGLAIGALAVLIIRNWDTIKNATIVAFNAVKNAIAAAFNWVKANWPLLLAIITGPIGAAVLVIIRNWNTIRSVTMGVWNAIRGIVTGVIGAIRGAVSAGFNAIVGVIRGTMGTARSIVDGAVNGIKRIFGTIAGSVAGALQGLTGIITAPFETAASIIEGIIRSIINAITAIPQAISDAISHLPGAGFAKKALGAIPGFQHGGIDDFGTGTAAVLHGREAILPLDDPLRAASLAARAGIGGTTLNIVNNFTSPVTPSRAAQLSRATTNGALEAIERRRVHVNARTT